MGKGKSTRDIGGKVNERWAVRNKSMTPQQTIDYWYKWHRFQKRYEAMYTPVIYKALRKQIKQFEETGTTLAINSDPIFEALYNLYITTGPVWAAYSNSLLPRRKARMPMGFSEKIVALMRSAFSYILKIAEDITTKTKEIITRILSEAAQSGASFSDIVREIESTTELGKVRARLIARTEVLGAANYAAYENAKSLGIELNKTWVAAKDKRTRRTPRDQFDHLHMDGVTIGLFDKFTVSGEIMEYPGDGTHASAGNICNCRCVAAYLPVGG